MIEYLENGINVNGEFTSLKQITEKCNEVKLNSRDLVILKIHWSSRGGDVCEQRVYDRVVAEEVKELLVDKFVDFGEIWGKHSEVFGDIEYKDMSFIEDKKEIKQFLLENPNGSYYDHSFIESVFERYEEALEYEEELDEDYVDDLERLKEIIG